MKISDILKRAWKILWSYRALWVFGVILLLTTTTSSNNFNWTESRNDATPEMQFSPDEPFWPQVLEEMEKGLNEAFREIDQMLETGNPDKLERNFMRAAVIVMVVLFVLGLIGTVLRYIAETALIRMVDHYEETAEKLKAREGWRLGWDRRSWRMFLLDVAIYLPGMIIFLVVMGAALAPIIMFSTGQEVSGGGVLGLVSSIGLMMIFGLFALIVAAFVSLVKPVIFRKIALEDMAVWPAVKEGWQMFRSFWKKYGLLWLILKGINMAWPLVMIPFALLSGGIGILLGGGFTFLAGGNAIQSGDPAMVGPIVVGVILFILVLAIPLAFLGGLREVYESTSWTLAYRELKAEGLLANGNGGTLLLPEEETA